MSWHMAILQEFIARYQWTVVSWLPEDDSSCFFVWMLKFGQFKKAAKVLLLVEFLKAVEMMLFVQL